MGHGVARTKAGRSDERESRAGIYARASEEVMARSTEGRPKRQAKVGPAGEGTGQGAGGEPDRGPGRVSVRLAPEEIARIDALAEILAGDGPPKARAEMLRHLVRRGLELLEQRPDKARALLSGVALPEATAPPSAGGGRARRRRSTRRSRGRRTSRPRPT